MKTNLIKDLVIRPNMKVKLNEWDPDYDGGIFKKEVESTLNKDLLDRMSDLQVQTVCRQKSIIADNSSRN